MRIILFLCFAALLSGCAPAILKAAKQGDTAQVRTALEAGKVKQMYVDRTLCIAAGAGNKEMLGLLLDRGANPSGERPGKIRLKPRPCPCGPGPAIAGSVPAASHRRRHPRPVYPTAASAPAASPT